MTFLRRKDQVQAVVGRHDLKSKFKGEAFNKGIKIEIMLKIYIDLRRKYAV